jgi:hypothetical protein
MSQKRTEADLCRRFIDDLEDGWTVYPETCGWDMLLVLEKPRELSVPEQRVWQHSRDLPLAPGTQLGIEAKLRCNCTVLRQALPRRMYTDVEDTTGPDFRAVLVPKVSGDFATVARHLDLVVLEGEPHPERYRGPDAKRLEQLLRHARAWPHMKQYELPEIVPRCEAGVPSPSTLSRWKVAAIKLCLRLRANGFVTRSDFNELGLSTSIWYHRWVVKGERVGRVQRWVREPGWTPWDEVHADEAAQLLAKDAEATA